MRFRIVKSNPCEITVICGRCKLSKAVSQLNIDGVQVYVATFDANQQVSQVEPAIRTELIANTSDRLTRQQRYCVWKLLNYALGEQFGLGVADFNFIVDANGKWQTDCGVCFSLSHSNRGVAVALCCYDVGVDLQLFDSERFDARLAGRILNDDELALYNSTAIYDQPRLLAEKWCQKESLFKLNGGANFAPKSVNTVSSPNCTTLVTLDGAQYILSVATYANMPVSIHLVEDNSLIFCI